MKLDVLRRRRHQALTAIKEETGIDPSEYPKMPKDHEELFFLEEVAEHLINQHDIESIADIDGIGEATMEKIREGLNGS